MAQLYTFRISSWIERLLNAKGSPAIVDVDTAARVVIPWPSGVEDRYSQSWRRFGVSGNTGSTAATNQGFQIRNPSTSQAVCVIERLGVGTQTVVTRSQITVGQQQGTADLPNVVTPTKLDARNPGGSAMVVTETSTTSTVGLSAIAVLTINNGAESVLILTPNQELALYPGDTVRLFDNTQAEALTCNIIWRERSLETSELTG